MAFIQKIIYLKYRIGAYLTNPDEYQLIGTDWIAFYVNAENLLVLKTFKK